MSIPIFPKIERSITKRDNFGKAFDYFVLMTKLRIERDGVWYQIICRQDYTTESLTTESICERYDRFIEMVYQCQLLNEVNTSDFNDYVDPDQTSETQRIKKEYDKLHRRY